uniref:Uncharacterized protein n=1 Tax=Caenorhabditis japonica TaxID=281687 RepID=A0A8R1EQU7_CAEJA
MNHSLDNFMNYLEEKPQPPFVFINHIKGMESLRPVLEKFSVFLQDHNKDMKSLIPSIQDTIKNITSMKPLKNQSFEEVLDNHQKISDDFILGFTPNSFTSQNYNNFVAPKYFHVAKNYEQLLDRLVMLSGILATSPGLPRYLDRFEKIREELSISAKWFGNLFDCGNENWHYPGSRQELKKYPGYLESIKKHISLPEDFQKTVTEIVNYLNATKSFIQPAVRKIVGACEPQNLGEPSKYVTEMNHLIESLGLLQNLKKTIDESRQKAINYYKEKMEVCADVEKGTDPAEYEKTIWDKDVLQGFAIVIGGIRLLKETDNYLKKMWNVKDWLDDEWKEKKEKIGKLGMNASKVQTISEGVEALIGLLDLTSGNVPWGIEKSDVLCVSPKIV